MGGRSTARKDDGEPTDPNTQGSSVPPRSASGSGRQSAGQGVNLRLAFPTRNRMLGESLHEVLARDRQRYERLVYGRLRDSITWEDAEDIVSDALLKTQGSAGDRPVPGKEEAWFCRIVLNQGIDFLRSRDGRKRDGSAPRPGVVSLNQLGERGVELPAADDDGTTAEGDDVERKQAREIVARVMQRLDPEDADLVKIRHLAGPQASRRRVAEMAGLTVGEFRWRYARAWARFVEAVAVDAPTPRCHHIRELLGEVEAGAANPAAVAGIDAHPLACASCRVSARDSYRALELLPITPSVAAIEQWTSRVSSVLERSAPETAAGAGTAAAGAGIASVLGGGGAVGTFKALVLLCGATAVTAGVCGGVAAVLEELDKHPPRPAAKVRVNPKVAREAPRRPTLTPAAYHPARPAPVKPKPRPHPTVDTSGETKIPAPAPAGSSEFTPSASSARVQPAPAPANGGGEFSP